MSAAQAELEALAAAALANGHEAGALVQLAQWSRLNPESPAILLWQALLLRALDRRAEALPLLHRAAGLAPSDGGIAHTLAQTALEAGLPAAGLFEQALQLDPGSAVVRLGLTSARYAGGDGVAALEALEAALAHNPGWYDGHRQFAQLATMLGQPERLLATLRTTIARFPDAPDPYLVAAELQMAAGDFAGALELSKQALARAGDDTALWLVQATALDELGESAAAEAAFARAGPAETAADAVRLIRHALRAGDARAALKLAEPWLASADATQVWPYVSLAWRLLGDDRAVWLEQQPGLVNQIDLAPEAIDLPALAQRLRAIHAGSGRFLDQSVRFGTQTDGPLFARIEPELVAVRKVMSDALAAHIAKLPPSDERHPQLAPRRDRDPRFAGSWSVRLVDEGFHASHQHPQGWFSAVLYIAVPAGLTESEGQLVLGGAPPELGLNLAPYQTVVPSPGRLVIFPSTMWHATLPYKSGERMAIAFDIARPIEEP